MSSLTVIILTKNEEKHITEVIKNAQCYASDVLVVDSGSTDGTVELAKAAGAMVCFRALEGDFSAQRNFALTQTTAEWVLYLDADERLSETTGKAIMAITGGNKLVQGKMQRLNIAFGHQFKYGAFGPDEVTRLFPREKVTWVGKVHEHPECDLPVEMLLGALEHHTYDTWQQWWNKAGHYTTIWADDKFATGKRTTLASAIVHTIAGMFKVLILQKGILEGGMGLVSTWQHGIYTLSKYMKLLELQSNDKEK